MEFYSVGMPCKIVRLLLVVVCVYGVSEARAQTAKTPAADLVLIHGKILTVDAKDSIAQAVAVRAGKIVAVGTDTQVLELTGAGTTVVDLHGRTATPGLIDTHSHHGEHATDGLSKISLVDATSIAEVVRRVQARVATAKPGEWILGNGWNEATLAEHRYVMASDLDKVAPNNPVMLGNTTGHYSAVNSYALRLGHIDDTTKDPPAGTIDRDAAGHATGVMKEGAKGMIPVVSPQATVEQVKGGIVKEVEEMQREGMTGMKDIVGSETILKAYRALHEEGKLEERVCLLVRAGSTMESAKATLAYLQQMSPVAHAVGDGRLVMCGAKIFMDGSAIGRTAWTYTPWYKSLTEVDAGNVGYPQTDPEVYRQMVRLFHQAGWSVGTHAIGERAVDWVVDTYAEVLKEKPTVGLRHSIIHANIPTAHAIETMAMLEKTYDAGYPEVQPAFLWWLGTSMPPSLGPQRLPRTIPLATYLKSGIRWGAGSDYAVVPFAGRYGLWASVEREATDGTHPFGMGEAVDIHSALRSYTAWAAPQLFLEHEVGTIEVGKRADLAIWDRDMYTAPSEELKNLRCEMTIFDGGIVYTREGTAVTVSQRIENRD
jgi:predicted amidohydrolase YtcJ